MSPIRTIIAWSNIPNKDSKDPVDLPVGLSAMDPRLFAASGTYRGLPTSTERNGFFVARTGAKFWPRKVTR